MIYSGYCTTALVFCAVFFVLFCFVLFLCWVFFFFFFFLLFQSDTYTNINIESPLSFNHVGKWWIKLILHPKLAASVFYWNGGNDSPAAKLQYFGSLGKDALQILIIIRPKNKTKKQDISSSFRAFHFGYLICTYFFKKCVCFKKIIKVEKETQISMCISSCSVDISLCIAVFLLIKWE